MSLSSLQSSLTAVWHVGVAYTAGSLVELVCADLGAGRHASKTSLALSVAGQIGGGYLLLTEIMGLLTGSWTPIGDGISSSAFILAQPSLIAKLHRIKAELVPVEHRKPPAQSPAGSAPVQQQ